MAVPLPPPIHRVATRFPATPDPRAVRARFTLDGEEALEDHLALTCERIAAGIRGLVPARRLEAVLLGGGYGRGEGGVLRDEDGHHPYNDLEYYVCVRGNRHLNRWRYGRALHVLGEILTPQAGVDVEFHLTSLRELERSRISMFSYDLLSGHRYVVGEERQLAGCRHHLDAALIPLAEGTRLLMNRCSGLLFAAERLERGVFTPADADFVARNIAKAQLGAGDAVLVAFGHYHWSVRERHRRLERLARTERAAWFADVLLHHAEGTEFKLHPSRTQESREALRGRHQHVTDFCRSVWLWFEHRRLGVPFRSVRDYVDCPLRKDPESGRLRNLLVNARVLGPRAAFRDAPLAHPRERILAALPLLLWTPRQPALPENLQRLQTALRTNATEFAALVHAYRELWAKVN